MLEDRGMTVSVVRQSLSHGRARTVPVAKGTLPERQRTPKKRGPVTVAKEKRNGSSDREAEGIR
jgi:hypothetical protein